MIIQRPPEEIRVEMNRFLTQIFEAVSILPTFRQTRVAANYTVIATDYYVGVTNTAAPRTITLPALASIPLWVQLVIKDESGGAAANNITIDGSGAETIDGAATKVINTNYGVVRLTRSSTAWFTW